MEKRYNDIQKRKLSEEVSMENSKMSKYDDEINWLRYDWSPNVVYVWTFVWNLHRIENEKLEGFILVT